MKGNQEESLLVEPLTRRELEIVALLSNGLSNREIAEALTVAPSTVKWYLKQIYSKIGVGNRKAAVERAQSLGLLGDVRSQHSLPTETTKFIGREPELRRIQRDLRDPNCRLLTLVGLGGVGKTRLATAAAWAIAQGDGALFKDGVHFVPLADQSKASRLAPTIASELDFSLSGAGEPAEQLLNHLRRKQMLLVLDNFEQLLEGANFVADLLAAAPRIKLLVTSRRPLNLSEEWRFDLGGLPVPHQTGANLLDNKAAELFVERATRVRADFAWQDNAASIAQICALVGGMPLAIELAASWIRSLSGADIATEIEASLDFLEASLRNVPQRHHSMRVVFNQSWSQLSPAEKNVFRSLAVFSGGFTLPAAKEVAGATPTTLTSLVDKSLVKRYRADRYQMHKLLQRYAAGKLADLPELEQGARQAHGRYYSQLAASHERGWKGGGQLVALEIFRSEIDNLLAAWEWNLARADFKRLGQMLTSMAEYFFWLGPLQEGIQLCRDLRQRLLEQRAGSEREQRPLLLLSCWALLWESTLVGQLQDTELVHELLDAAEELLDSAGADGSEHRRLQAHIWLQRGRMGVFSRRKIVKQYLDRSLTAFSELDDQWALAATWYWRGIYSETMGDGETALTAMEESHARFQKLDDRRNVASATDGLAVAMRNMDRLDGIEALHLEAISAARELKDYLRVGWMLHNLTWTYWLKGDFQAGSETAQACIATAEEISIPRLMTPGKVALASCLLHLGEYERTVELVAPVYLPSLDGYLARSVPVTLGDGALGVGDSERALDVFSESSRTLLEAGVTNTSMSFAGLCLAALSLGRPEEAEAHLNQALPLAIGSKQQIQLRRVLVAAAAVLAARSENSRAAELMELAFTAPHFSNSAYYQAIATRFVTHEPGRRVGGDEGPTGERVQAAAEALLKNGV